MKTRNSLIFNCIAILLMTSVVLLTGCDSKSSSSSTTDQGDIDVAVTATPSQVDIYTNVVVEAQVLDGTTPVANQEVRFTVSPSVAGWFSEDTVMTDENGLAATIFNPSVEGDMTITANTDAGLSTSNASTDIRVTSGGGPGIGTSGIINSIFLSADSMNLVVKHTGGIESATLRAVGLDIEGNTVPEGTQISFYITDGPGGEEHLDTLGYGPVTVETDGFGMATVVLHSGERSGTVRIRAMANDTVLSNATQIMVSAGPPKYIVLAADGCNLPLWGTVGVFVGVVAVVSDTFHNPVNDSTLVYFTTDEGTMVSHRERTHDLEGVVHTAWISGYADNSIPTPDGDVWIYAETAGGTVLDSTMFYNSGPLTTITYSPIFPVPDSMWADGVSEASVQIYGWDGNDNPVVDGYQVEGDAYKLTVPNVTLEYVCGSAASFANLDIKSATLTQDHSTTGGNDDGIGYIDFVSFESIFYQAVVLKTGMAYKKSCEIFATTSIRVGETATIDVVIKDRWSNPLGDHTMVANYPAGGAPGPGTIETNPYGEANDFSWTPSPADTGDFLITITDMDPRGSLSLSTTISVAP